MKVISESIAIPPIMANTRLQHGSFSSSYRVVTNMFLTRCHFGAEVMYRTWTQVMYSTNQAKYQLSGEHLVTFVAPPTYAVVCGKIWMSRFLELTWLKTKQPDSLVLKHRRRKRAQESSGKGISFHFNKISHPALFYWPSMTIQVEQCRDNLIHFHF